MNVKIKFNSANPNTASASDSVFVAGGKWEQDNGRFQTRRFAECFVKHFAIPLLGKFTFLDLGCALGDGLPVIKKYYPDAELYGCDFSQVAIERCKEVYGHMAIFFVSAIDKLEKEFDVIYCSNLIEHIENHIEIVNELINYSKILYILTPYNELYNGARIRPDSGYWHVATFDEHTFNAINDTKSIKVSHKVFRCPRAWDNSRREKIAGLLLQRPYTKRLQICYEFINLPKLANRSEERTQTR